MTDEPSTPPSQEPPRSAPVTITRSFGEMDGHIDQLHASIGDRVAKEKSVAFEIIMKWQEVEQIARNGWYERYGCETIFDYCARCYGYSERDDLRLLRALLRLLGVLRHPLPPHRAPAGVAVPGVHHPAGGPAPRRAAL